MDINSFKLVHMSQDWLSRTRRGECPHMAFGIEAVKAHKEELERERQERLLHLQGRPPPTPPVSPAHAMKVVVGGNAPQLHPPPAPLLVPPPAINALDQTALVLRGFPPCTIKRPCIPWTHMHPKMASFAFFKRPGPSVAKAASKNKHLADQVEQLLKSARSGSRPSDVYRVFNYPRVIYFLNHTDVRICNEKDLEHAMGKWGNHGVGSSTLAKLKDILRTGGTARTEETQYVKACVDLQRVWGIGPATAQALVRGKNIFSVEHLKSLVEDRVSFPPMPKGAGNLGLPKDSWYCLSILEDLETRIPRAEVEEIIEVAKRAADEVWGVGKVSVTCCGSYRRGVKADCGDVDLLISHVDPDIIIPVSDIMSKLREWNILTWILKTPVDNQGQDTQREAGREVGGGGRFGGVPVYNDDSNEEEEEGEELGSGPEGEEEEEGGEGGAGKSGEGATEKPWWVKRSDTICQAVNDSHSVGVGVKYRLLPKREGGGGGKRRKGEEKGKEREVGGTEKEGEEGEEDQLHTHLSQAPLLPHPPSYYSARVSSAMTVIKLGEGRLHRRLDLKVYPKDVLPFALLYFTGSDHYNRSLRAFVNKCGWTLSDHGLSSVSRRDTLKSNGKKQREIIAQTNSVACSNEMDVLRAIGVPWRAPCEREV